MSNDLISRKETERLLRAYADEVGCNRGEYELANGILKAACFLRSEENIPTAYDVDKQWIPCSERLPEESLESVIGWDEYRERCCFVQYYNGQWILGNSNASVKIVAWMPLPNPYKKN